MASLALPIVADSVTARPSARRKPLVISHQHGDTPDASQREQAENDSQRRLAKSFAPEALKKLRANFVPDREDKEVKENRLRERIDLDVRQPDHDPDEKRTCHGAKRNRPELKLSEEISQRQRGEQRQLRVMSQ